MRAIRVAVAGVAAVAATLAVPPSLAHAAPAAAPAAPYDVFTVDGAGNSWLSPAGQSYTIDDSNGTFSVSPWGTGLYLQVLGATNVSVTIEPPTGTTLGVGSYQTTRSADASHAMLDVGIASHGCNQSDGTLNVTEYSTDGSGAVTAFAATYSANCDGESRPVNGEIRWHSTKDYVAATQAPATNAFAFGNVDLGQTTGTKTVTVTATGSQPIHFQNASMGGRDAPNFTLGADTCSNATLSYGQTCTVSVTAHPTKAGDLHTDLVIPDDTASGGRDIPVSATGIVGAAGTYYPLNPTRILDTRSGNGAPVGQVGAGGVIHLQVTGRGNVPASGVSAVVLNVTVTSATAASYLTVWPEGGSRPLVSNIDFPAGWTGANSTTVPVGTGGKVDIYNLTGKVSVIADIVGYYAKDDTVLSTYGRGGQFLPIDPWRWYDSREQGADGPLGSGGWEWMWLAFEDPSFNSHIRAVSVNITAVNPTATGFFTAWNGTGNPPTGTSTLNFTKGRTVPNMTVVPTAPCTADISPDCVGDPMIAVYNSSGNTDLIVDLFGVYDDGTTQGGLRFRAVNPVRITDSRIGQGLPRALGTGVTGTVTVPGSILNDDTESLALNVTGVAPTADTYLTLWPAGESRPATSNLDPAKGSTVANTANIPLGGAILNQFSVYNHAGTANVLVDVQGAFDYYPYTPSNQSTLKAATVTPSSSPSMRAHFQRH